MTNYAFAAWQICHVVIAVKQFSHHPSHLDLHINDFDCPHHLQQNHGGFTSLLLADTEIEGERMGLN